MIPATTASCPATSTSDKGRRYVCTAGAGHPEGRHYWRPEAVQHDDAQLTIDDVLGEL